MMIPGMIWNTRMWTTVYWILPSHKWESHTQVGDTQVVWACDAKRGTLRRKEGNGNESTWEKEERKT